jgi:alpha-glucosidase
VKVTRREAFAGLGAVGAMSLLRLDTDAQGQPFTVGGQRVEVRLASLSPVTLRLTVTRVKVPGTPAEEVPGTFLARDGALVQFSEHFRRLPTSGRVRVGDLTAQVSANPLNVKIFDANGRLVQDLKVPGTVAGQVPGTFFEFLLGDRPVLGLGEGGPQYDRRGALDPMRNGQGGYQLRTHGGRVPIQWLIGPGGWALFVHQPLGGFDLRGPTGRLTASDLPLDVFVVGSTDPVVIMREYARITGLPEMPPLWSFGYQQSHRTLNGPDEVMWVARTMRDKKLPCDALIYLGTDFTPSGWNTHNGEFAWNPKNFPDPKKAIDDLHALHYKVVLHVVIEGRHLTGTVHDACTSPEPSGRIPDASGDVTKGKWPDDRHVGCYWPYHKGVFDLGVDGWWPDQGDGYDAPSRLNRIRMYWEGSQLSRPDERPYALHRNGYAGMARYGAFLWSGDVYSTWETLRTHVSVGINAGLSGIPYWGTDIGGFVPTPEFLSDLYVRWFQFGAFCPLFRAHGRTWHLRLPWGWNLGEIGPDETSAYSGAGRPPESELHHPEVEPICRKFLELRYRLMPYLYSAVRETSRTGLPIMRALWLHYPDDPVAAARGDEYLWGRDFLVAPVVEKDARARRLYLPKGDWYDFWTNERISGGREIDRTVDLSTMPLYLRAGAIVPMDPVRQYTSQPVTDPMTVTIYPGADGAFDLFEDDGRSFEYRRGAWMGVEFRWHDRDRRLSLALSPGSRMGRPAVRDIDVRVAGGPSRRIRFDGRRSELYLTA